MAGKTRVPQPIKCAGGKGYLAKRIVELMPPHLTYVEPYFGGGAVLLERDPLRDWAAVDGKPLPASQKGCSEIVNDIDGDLTNFWLTLQNPKLFPQFQRQAQAIPCGEPQFKAAQKMLHISNDPVARAVAYFVSARQSRSANHKSFTPIAVARTRRGMNELPSAWLSAIEGLPDVHARLQRVVILTQPALKVIKKFDKRGVLFYIDAPYVHATRAVQDHYRFEMTDGEHEELVATLVGLKHAKAIVSMYSHPIYNALSRKHGWRLVKFTLPNNMGGGKSKRKMVECLWLNFH